MTFQIRLCKYQTSIGNVSLTLGDYLDEYNANTELQFSDIEFDSMYYDIGWQSRVSLSK